MVLGTLTLLFRITNKAEKSLTGNGHDYMNLALKDGGVSLTVQLGTGKLDTAIKPNTVRFDDNAWHHVLVVRKSSEVTNHHHFFIHFK